MTGHSHSAIGKPTSVHPIPRLRLAFDAHACNAQW